MSRKLLTTSRIQLVRESITKITQVLSDKKIAVTQIGSDAYVQRDPRTDIPVRVNLPFLPDNASDELLFAVQGFLDHEVGHLLFTDFAPITEFQKTSKKSENAIRNIVEDTFVERKMKQAFRGSSTNFGHLSNFITTRIFDDRYKEIQENPAMDTMDKFSRLAPAILRAWAGDENMAEYLEDKWDSLVDVTDKIPDAIRNSLKSVQNSQESIDVAKRVYKAMTEEEKPESEGDDSDDSGDSGDSDGKSKSKEKSKSKDKSEKGEEDESKPEKDKKTDDSDEDESESEADDSEEDEVADDKEPDDSEDDSDGEESDESEDDDGDSDDGDDGDDDDDDSDGDDSDADGGSDADDGGSDDGGSDYDPSEAEEEAAIAREKLDKSMDSIDEVDSALNKELSKEVGEAARYSNYMPLTTDYDVIHQMPDDNFLKIPEFDSKVSKLQERVRDVVGVSTKILERAFIAKSRSYWQPGLRKGRLNTSALSRLKLGDDRVFRKKEETKSKNSAVSLVVDLSGSMDGQKVQCAAMTCWALSEILTRLKIPHEIVGFTTIQSDTVRFTEFGVMNVMRARINEEMDKCSYNPSRSEAIYMPIIKDFDETLSTKTYRRFTSVFYSAWGFLGQNVDGESVMIAARRLAVRPEEKKSMIVLSDGQPSAGIGSQNPHQSRYLKETVKNIESAGIDCVGLGIKTSAVSAYYSKKIIINNPEELPKHVMQELTRILME